MEEIPEEFLEKEEQINHTSYKKISISLLVLVVLFSSFFGGFYWLEIEKNEANRIAEREKAYYEDLLKKDKAYYESLLQNKPSALQNSFAEDIKSGVNDADTKSSAYFITHRFFDNGGNIYEIYDYIESHPELSFLKEAENIYPDVFREIKDKKLPLTYTGSAFYAYLAYVEVLYKNGYADVAAVATAANQYAGNSYFKTVLAKEFPEESSIFLKNIQIDKTKAVKFLAIADNDIKKIIEGNLNSSEIPARDILVGLNQYASALRYLEAIGVNATSSKTSREVFSFAMDYSASLVLELNMFTSLINASTLAILSSSTSDEIKIALGPILNFDTKKPSSYKGSVIKKIIASRFEQKPKESSYIRMDIYSKRNVILLGNKVPEFKTWLISNGWTEADFK